MDVQHEEQGRSHLSWRKLTRVAHIDEEEGEFDEAPPTERVPKTSLAGGDKDKIHSEFMTKINVKQIPYKGPRRKKVKKVKENHGKKRR
mmetsp:Transcript_4333/g.6918  ORF Transcript_4333/g.6918 Transcript_4333/m.6918 type:complete len:89 (+) Transcript_4333:76-342(+)